MSNPLKNDKVLEKAATFAVGCAAACGLVATSWGAAASSGAALVGVLGAIGLQKIFKERPKEEQIFRDVLKALPRKYDAANDADPAALQDAVDALAASLDSDALFSIGELERAVKSHSVVVDGLVKVTMLGLSRRDPRFAQEGLFQDLALDVVTAAFRGVLSKSPTFAAVASLIVGQETLGALRKSHTEIIEKVGGLATKQDLTAVVERLLSELKRNQESRGSSYLDSFFLLKMENGSQTLGAAIDNRGRIVGVSYGRQVQSVMTLRSRQLLNFKAVGVGDLLVELRVDISTSGIFADPIGDIEAIKGKFDNHFRAFDPSGEVMVVNLNAVAMTPCRVVSDDGDLFFRDLWLFELPDSARNDGRRAIAGPILDEDGSVVALSVASSSL